MRRLSRPCYDKYHRCPGWVGGGMKYAKRKRCDGGYIDVNWDDPWWEWKFWPCSKCNVIVLPYHANKLSITWLAYQLRRRYRNWRDDRQYRRQYR